jgi:hypothetical protein
VGLAANKIPRNIPNILIFRSMISLYGTVTHWSLGVIGQCLHVILSQALHNGLSELRRREESKQKYDATFPSVPEPWNWNSIEVMGKLLGATLRRSVRRYWRVFNLRFAK